MNPPRTRRRRHPLPLAVLIAGLLLSALASWQMRRAVENELATRFATESRQIAAAMQQEFAFHEEALRGLQGLFAAFGTVSREDFRRYVTLLDLVRRYPAIRQIRFARHVTAAELPAWRRQVLTSLAALGEDADSVAMQPPGARGEYLLVEYLEPFAANRAQLGRDLFSDPARQPAIARTRASLRPALSSRLAEFSAPHYALLAALPPTPQRAFPGIVTVIFDSAALVAAVAHTHRAAGLDLEIYETDTAAARGRQRMDAGSDGAAAMGC